MAAILSAISAASGSSPLSSACMANPSYSASDDLRLSTLRSASLRLAMMSASASFERLSSPSASRIS